MKRKPCETGTVSTAHMPALTLREVRLAAHDRDTGAHWSYARCWCGEFHADGAPPSLRIVPPPWDESRDTE